MTILHNYNKINREIILLLYLPLFIYLFFKKPPFQNLNSFSILLPFEKFLSIVLEANSLSFALSGKFFLSPFNSKG